MEATNKPDLSDDDSDGEQKAEPQLTEKEKQLRDSLMKDIYNDMSSSSDEEETKASDITQAHSASPEQPKKKGEYTEQDIQQDLERLEQRKAAKMAEETLKELFGDNYDENEEETESAEMAKINK
jgi:hypothetical protein